MSYRCLIVVPKFAGKSTKKITYAIECAGDSLLGNRWISTMYVG